RAADRGGLVEKPGVPRDRRNGTARRLRRRRRAMRLKFRLGLAALALIGLALAAAPTQAAGVSADAFIRQWDADHDGTLSLDEVKKAAGARFDQLDRDHDGTLDRRELGATRSPRELRQAHTGQHRTLDKDE